jgi:hypothetical protein
VLTTTSSARTHACSGVRVIRISPGWLHLVVHTIRRLIRPGSARSVTPDLLPASTFGLNWRGRLMARTVALVGTLSFPDLRASWNPGAMRALRRLVAARRPDVVVTSHEPASVLSLGFAARRMGVPWVADLGDPILAPYTPPRWRGVARRLERRVCKTADMVMVTTETYRDALIEQRGLASAHCTILRQGFHAAPPNVDECAPADFDPERLELLFTGQFYTFRRPTSLLNALAALEGVRLTVISMVPDPLLVEACARLCGKLRVLGPLPHRCIAAWQARADVLVNIGNRLPMQIPGKLFEYFGSGRSVMHLSHGDPDESARLILERRRGWVVQDEPHSIRTQLLELQAAWREGRLESGLDLSREAVLDFSWPSLAGRLDDALAKAVDEYSRRKLI